MISSVFGSILSIFLLFFGLAHGRQFAKITTSSVNSSTSTLPSAFWEGEIAYIAGYSSSSSASFIVRSDDFGMTWQTDQSISSARFNGIASATFGGVLYRIAAGSSSNAYVYNNGSASWQTYSPRS
eukprot:scaffold14705_cov249-Ochromonas_danica.AAC.7